MHPNLEKRYKTSLLRQDTIERSYVMIDLFYALKEAEREIEELKRKLGVLEDNVPF